MSDSQQKYTFRQARLSDAGVLTELAHQSKRFWGYEESLIELWQGDLTFTEEVIASQIVHVAEEDGVISGVFAISRDQDKAELEALWIHPDAIGQGLGAALFRKATHEARKSGASSLLIVSDPHAAGFYRHMGAQLVGMSPSVPAGRSLPTFLYTLTETDSITT